MLPSSFKNMVIGIFALFLATSVEAAAVSPRKISPLEAREPEPGAVLLGKISMRDFDAKEKQERATPTISEGPTLAKRAPITAWTSASTTGVFGECWWDWNDNGRSISRAHCAVKDTKANSELSYPSFMILN
jgi:hypothetical protein